ncbi:MAG: TIGR01777 family oxidoreductase [Cephaloticoccus sp.]|nr:TIGR01777 family oxidoreductase [Cephaloticoccus sp.]MCF7760970.1 TIGR01777 family oxidoreductase [Cephaloticoccus sp.]
MLTRKFRLETRIERSAAEVYAWHGRPGAFARLQPPWEKVELPDGHPGIFESSRVTVRTKIGPFYSQWVVEHRDVIPGIQFRDVMLEGPFAQWIHTHRFVTQGDCACLLIDEIEYALPLAPLGNLCGDWIVRRKLNRMFRYRHVITKHDLERENHGVQKGPRRILVSGASGMIGSALVPFLQTQGHQVLRLVRRQSTRPGEIFWRPETGELDDRALGKIDAVVHLAGSNVAAGRWTANRRRTILDSRVQSTRTLVAALERLVAPPAVFVCASAVGYYGNRDTAKLTEKETVGGGFLAGVSEQWERESDQAQSRRGIRVVQLRIGVVLAAAGGALGKMLPVFRCGLGGRLATGRQIMSWIALEDLLSVIDFALTNPEVKGPINTVSPLAVTNGEFTNALGKVLGRPTVLPVPQFVLRLIFGQMADETLLASTWAIPKRLTDLKFKFRLPIIDAALRETLGS